MDPSAGLIPYVLGVTGHRDLAPEHVPALEAVVRRVLQDLRERMPATPLLLLSALAPGADQLVARVALESGARLTAILPMPAPVYASQMSPEAQSGFAQLLEKASACIQLPGDSVDSEQLACSEELRQDRYEALARYLARNSQALIALWDGVAVEKPGATARVVAYHLNGVPEDEAAPGLAAGSGAVYHIRTPRQSQSAGIAEPFRLEILHGGSDPALEADAPAGHVDAYNRSVKNSALDFAPACAQLAGADSEREPAELPHRTAWAHYAADSLSIRYSRRTKLALKLLLLCALVAAAGYETYAHILPDVPALWLVYPGALLAGWLVYRRTVRHSIETRYLDYRALAEALRVQFYWSLCGIREPAARRYLRRHGAGIDWVRSALRALYLSEPPTAGASSAPGIQQTLRYWVEPQADWYARKAERQGRTLELVEKRSNGLLLGVWLLSVLIPLSLITPLGWLSRWQAVAFQQPWHGLLLLLIPVPSLAAGLCRIWVEQAGFAEQVRNYRRTARVFREAARQLRLLDENGETEKASEVIHRLGIESLEENAEWLLLHRNRPLKVVAGG